MNPEMMSRLAGLAGQNAASQDAGKPLKDVSKQQPLLHLCKIIDSSGPEIKRVLAGKLEKKITVDNNTFYKIPMNIYEDIAKNTSSKYAEVIQNIFNVAGQDGENLRISMLIQAKNNYMTKDDDGLFTTKYDNYAKFKEILDTKFDEYLSAKRDNYEASLQRGGEVEPSMYNDPNYQSPGTSTGGQIPGVTDMLKNGIPGVTDMLKNGIPGAADPNAQKQGTQPVPAAAAAADGGASKDLELLFDKVYGKGNFQKRVTNIVLKKVNKIAKTNDKTDQINILLEGASKKVVDTFEQQLKKFIESIQADNHFFNLCIISAIGPKYIEEYYAQRDNNPEQTLSEYIDALIMSKKNIVNNPEEVENTRQPRIITNVDLASNTEWIRNTVNIINQKADEDGKVEALKASLQEGADPSGFMSNIMPSFLQPGVNTKPTDEIDLYGNPIQYSKAISDSNRQLEDTTEKKNIGPINYNGSKGGAKRKTKQRKGTRRRRSTRKVHKRNNKNIA